MEKESDYKIFSCEGRDHMGKGDALNFLYDKLEEEGVDVVTASFPIYGTPIGNTIRVLLKDGKERFDLTIQEDLEVKMSLFALNRLEFLEAFLLEDIDEETLILFDRSAFSNALTIAFGIKDIPEINEKDINTLVETALELDSLLIETLNLKKCVIQLDTGEEIWKSARGEDTDLHEVPEVQKLASEVYSIYEKLIGEGWKTIFTKDEEGKWKDREDIFNEIYSFLTERLGEFDSKKGQGRRGHIGIREVMKNIYVGSEVDENLLEEYVESIRKNQKSLMYATSVGVKEGICSSYKEISFENEKIKQVFNEILDRYPKIEYVLECNLGTRYVVKLREGLRSE